MFQITLNGLATREKRYLFQNIRAVTRVSLSGRTLLGSQLLRFEEEFASYNGVSHSVGVGNGLDALSIGLRGIGVGPGDEVIVPAITALATSLSVLAVGATPVLADVSLETGQLDLESVRASITDSTRAIILVHLFGLIADAESFASLAAEHNLDLIEDAAQSHGANLDGRKGGAFGRFAAYSFYPTKNLGAMGDAGALVTNDSSLAEFAKQFRNYGQSDRYTHLYAGTNSRLDEVHASMLRDRLRNLDEENSKRRLVAHSYEDLITNPAISIVHKGKFSEAHSGHLFVITAPNRSELSDYLGKFGIETQKHYPLAAHHQPAMKGRVTVRVSLKQSEELARNCLSLPCHPYLSKREVSHVAERINEFTPTT